MEQVEEGYKSQVLEVALLDVISQDRFSGMTMAEVIGTLELVKAGLLEEIG